MTIMSDAYRAALLARAKDRKTLNAANKAFGGSSQRLEAMYGKRKSENQEQHNASGIKTEKDSI